MSRSQILAHARADGRPFRLADDSSVLLSAGWPNVKVERQLLPPVQMTDRFLTDHLLAVQMRPPSVLTLRGEYGQLEWRPEPGEVHVVPAWTVSSPAWHEEIDVLQVALDPGYVERLAAEVAGSDRAGGQVHLTETVGADAHLRHLSLVLAAEAQAPGGGDLLLVESLTTALGVQLLRGYADLTVLTTPRPLAGHRRASSMVARVRERVEDALDQPVTIAELAAGEHLSVFHFTHAFKAAAGVPPYRYVTERRIERAKGLLVATDLAVSEIARRCGFSGSAQMARAFRRVLGASPTEFRQSTIADSNHG